jgi:hypothetical protein
MDINYFRPAQSKCPYIHEIHGKKKEEMICTCTIETLMKHGCQCGQFQREIKNALQK